jgi:hypothetical protein
MLLPGKTGGAIRADARTAAKTERAEGSGPQLSGPLLQPALDVSKGFGFRFGFGRHDVCMPLHIHTCQGKKYKAAQNSSREITCQPDFMRGFEFHDRNYLDMRGAEWKTADSFQLTPDARRFENWEFAHSLVLGLGEAARYAARVGIEAGGRRARELAAAVRDKLSALPGFRVLDRGKELAAIVTVEVPGWHSTVLVQFLRTRNINTAATLREYAVIDMDEKRAASALRISPHYYNTEAELDILIETLKSLPARAAAAE